MRLLAVSFLTFTPLLLWCGQGAAATAPDQAAHAVLTGKAALGDWTTSAPLVWRHITAADIPPPFSSEPSDNIARIHLRRADRWPVVPPGFKVELFQGGLGRPREIRTAPNGDIFIAESRWGRIRVLRGRDGAAKPEVNSVFATGLTLPFGMAFYPPGPNPRWLYVGDTDALVRFPYHNGDLKASGPPEKLLSLPARRAHWTRDVIPTADGRKLLVSVGSGSNYGDPPGNDDEVNRADILLMNPDGSDVRIYASGLRNAVSLATDPATGALWCSVNERDGLGDNLPPDYVTRVKFGGFYGWPWYYIGPHPEPRIPAAHPELKDKVIIPDVLLAAHSAPLGIAFYEATQFPKEYRGGIFVADHGSSNRSHFTGYKVIFVPVVNGAATGEYMDFMTGFVVPGDSQGKVWGRPVGVTVAHDGSLLVSDDASGSIWRVSYVGH